MRVCVCVSVQSKPSTSEETPYLGAVHVGRQRRVRACFNLFAQFIEVEAL